MDVGKEKEVRFDIYCRRCFYRDKEEKDEPCDECLENPVNAYSHKPIYYKEEE